MVVVVMFLTLSTWKNVLSPPPSNHNAPSFHLQYFSIWTRLKNTPQALCEALTDKKQQILAGTSERIQGECVTVVAKVKSQPDVFLSHSYECPKNSWCRFRFGKQSDWRCSLLKHQQTHASLDSLGRNYDRAEQKAQSLEKGHPGLRPNLLWDQRSRSWH